MSRPLKRPSSTINGDRAISPPPAKRRITATTDSNAIANFFTPTSQKVPEKVTFRVLSDHSVLAVHYQGALTADRPKPVKIATFDFDDTLITTKSGNKFAKGAEDWKWWHASVPSRLKQLHAEGYAVVVMSNQAAVSLRSDVKTPKEGMRSLNVFKGKVTAVLNALDLPMSVYAATCYDLFRKPRVGMWEHMIKDYGFSGDRDIDLANCVLVGDAGGREADKAARTRKDHSCSDRDFAANLGISFQTPEEFFLDEAPRPFVRAFEPAAYLEAATTADTDSSPVVFTKKGSPDRVDLVLFCGSPGAGKSTFYWRHLQPLGYERVNQDILKTRDKCMKEATKHLHNGKSVAVDNTNADIETRAAWVALARKLKVPIRLVHFTAPAKLCEHNDTVRALMGGPHMNPEARTLLPKLAFTGFAARYRPPKEEEGFEDITTVPFKFEGSEQQKRIWSKYWIS